MFLFQYLNLIKPFTGRVMRRQRGGDVRGNVRFPMERWNCFQLVLNGCPKTNNIQEGNKIILDNVNASRVQI